MTAQEIKRKILDFICRNFMVEEDEFEMDKSLVDQGVIDSLGLVEISEFLAQTFSFAVAETDMTRDNFGSVDKLVLFVLKKTSLMSSIPVRCSRCVISGSFPRIEFDEHGVCGFCRNRMFFSVEEAAIEKARTEIEAMFAAQRDRPGYHGVVCYSGGKDSTYTLLQAVRTYGLRVLAYTLDNGFIAPAAFDNMRRVVDALGVDHVIARPSAPNFRAIARACATGDIYNPRTLARISSICNACITMVNIGALRLALEKRIPLIISGFTLGQIPVNGIVFRSNYAFLHENRLESLRRLRAEAGECVDTYYTISDELLRNCAEAPVNVNPLCLENVTEQQIISRISTLGWTAPVDVDGCSSNCRLNTFNNYVHERRLGYNPYELELSHLIRKGLLSRDEALEKIGRRDEAQTRAIMAELGIAEGDLGVVPQREGPDEPSALRPKERGSYETYEGVTN